MPKKHHIAIKHTDDSMVRTYHACHKLVGHPYRDPEHGHERIETHPDRKTNALLDALHTVIGVKRIELDSHELRVTADGSREWDRGLEQHVLVVLVGHFGWDKHSFEIRRPVRC